MLAWFEAKFEEDVAKVSDVEGSIACPAAVGAAPSAALSEFLLSEMKYDFKAKIGEIDLAPNDEGSFQLRRVAPSTVYRESRCSVAKARFKSVACES